MQGWETKDYIPKDNFSWYQTYQKLLAQSQKELQYDTALLHSALTGIKNERANHQSRQVHESTVPKLPKMGGMKLVRNPRKKKVVVPTSTLTFGLGSRTKTSTGRGVIDKARREAKQHSLFSHKSSVLATPTHELKNYATQITTAPRGLVYEYRNPAAPSPFDPTIKAQPVFMPPKKRKREEDAVSSAPSPMSLEERERRLRALTNPNSTKSTARDTTPAADNASLSPQHGSPQSSSLKKPIKVVPRVPPVKRTEAPVNLFIPVKKRKIV